ncbi:hypothetical protein RKLH11_1686 [Rhodobacteraceae bacterium KLH11]|nr:hypothetical protein RKLH11_1686 [Rhodobacteraceae bacterium KLH11]
MLLNAKGDDMKPSPDRKPDRETGPNFACIGAEKKRATPGAAL